MFTRRSRSFALVVVSALLLLIPFAAAADEHIEERDLDIHYEPVAQGATLSLSGECPEAAGGQELTVMGAWPGSPEFGTVQADEDGSFAGEVQVPDDAPPGDQTISVACGDDVFVTGVVTITEVPEGAVETGLGGASTTTGPLAVFAVGLALLLGAGGALAVGRSRR
jgi:hypothetical protein